MSNSGVSQGDTNATNEASRHDGTLHLGVHQPQVDLNEGISSDQYVQPPKMDDGHAFEPAIGDTHGNAIKLAAFAALHQAVSFPKSNDGDTYKEMRSQYLRFESIPIEDLKKVKTSYGEREEYSFHHLTDNEKETLQKTVGEYKKTLNQLEFNSDNLSAIRLMGDELCDRGANDYLTLLFLKKLKDSGIEVKSCLSDHALDFIARWERRHDSAFNPSEVKAGYYLVSGNLSASYLRMHQMIEAGIITDQEVDELYQETVLPNLELFSLNWQNGVPNLGMHGSGTIEDLFGIAKKLGVDFDALGITKGEDGYYNLDKHQLAFLVDQVNVRFQEKIKEEKAAGVFTKSGSILDYDVTKNNVESFGPIVIPKEDSLSRLTWAYNMDKESYNRHCEYARRLGGLTVTRGHTGDKDPVVYDADFSKTTLSELLAKEGGSVRFDCLDMNNDIGKPPGRGETHDKGPLPVSYGGRDIAVREKRLAFEGQFSAIRLATNVDRHKHLATLKHMIQPAQEAFEDAKKTGDPEKIKSAQEVLSLLQKKLIEAKSLISSSDSSLKEHGELEAVQAKRIKLKAFFDSTVVRVVGSHSLQKSRKRKFRSACKEFNTLKKRYERAKGKAEQIRDVSSPPLSYDKAYKHQQKMKAGIAKYITKAEKRYEKAQKNLEHLLKKQASLPEKRQASMDKRIQRAQSDCISGREILRAIAPDSALINKNHSEKTFNLGSTSIHRGSKGQGGGLAKDASECVDQTAQGDRALERGEEDGNNFDANMKI